MKIGFIGLGLMGRAMVSCLQDAGHQLVVMGNRDRTGVEQALARGATEASSVAELTAAVQTVMICVSTSDQVEALTLGAEGVLSAAKAGQIVLDFGTSLPASTQKIGAAFAEIGAHYLDCPLGRTPAQALDGKLNIMVGGADDAFTAAKSILEVVGENVFHLGPLGAGNTVKLLNNYIGMTFVATVAEAYVAADAAGVSRENLYNVTGSGPIHSVMLDMISSYMVNGEKKMEFSIANASKDLGYFREMATTLGLENRMSVPSSEMFAAATQSGAGDDLVPQLIDWVSAQSKGALTRRMGGVQPREDRMGAGISLMILAVALFICVDTAAKWLILAGLPALQAAFLRYAGHLVFGMMLFIPQNGWSAFKTDRPVLQICRSLSLMMGTILNFLALSYLPITLTTTIQFTMPIVITILAIPILGEKVGLRRFIAVCVGFLGVLVVTQPWGAEWHPAMFFSFGAVTCASIYFILTRMMAGMASNATLQLWSASIPTLVLFPFVVAQWVWPDTFWGWLCFCTIGLFGLVSHMCATLAHRFAEAALLSPVFYCQILFATLSGVLVFDTWPTVYTLLGGMIIVASGLYIWLRERQIAKN